MNWEFWIIPIIAVAVWILGSIFRPKGDAADGAGREKPRRGSADLDRFLEEARRRRQEGTPRRPAPPPPPPPPAPVERRPRPQPAARRPRPQPTARRPDTERRPALEVVPIEEVRPVEPLVVVSAALRDAPQPSDPPPPPPLPAPATGGKRKAPLRVAGLPLLPLLRSRDGVRAAVILQEVFGPPLSRRPRPQP